MNRHHLFLASKPLDRPLFEDALNALGEPYEIFYERKDKGYFLADERFAVLLQGVIFTIHEDLGATLVVVACPKEGPLEEKAVKEALGYFPNQCLYLSDVLLRELSFGDYSSFPLLSAEFKAVPHEVLLTAGAYLRCGLNASLAAQSLFIHRNTFNYRLTQFMDLTGLDIRDYHNALLLELYFQLGTPR